MGIWDSLTDIFTGRPAQDAAAQNAQLYQQAQNAGRTDLNTGVVRSEDALRSARGIYSDFGNTFAGRYSPAVSTYLGALGVRGPEAATAARSAFNTSPGYDFARDEALKAIERSQAGRSMLLSGNTLEALQNRAVGLANQEYGSWLDRLGGFVAPEYNAALTSAQGQAGTYSALPSIFQTAAQGRANLGQNTAQNVAGTNDAAAQAQLGGSANLWRLGLGLAKLGSGAAGARFG